MDEPGVVSDYLQIFGEDASGTPPGSIFYQFGSDPVLGLGNDQVQETGDWQSIGRFFGVDDSFVQIRSDFEQTVVPIPAALPLFAGGLGLLAWMARRRRSQAAHA